MGAVAGHGSSTAAWNSRPPLCPDAGRRCQSEPGDLWVRHARHGPQPQDHRPELVRHDARQSAAVVRRASLARTAARSPACVRAGSACEGSRRRRWASSGPRSSSKCSAPAWTKGRPRSACAMRMASSARSVRGSTWSPFMDIDVFPNSIEYWGPTGMVFFRNVQVRWMPIQGDTRLTLALERPGASGDAGVLADRIELQNVKGRSPMPDITGEYRFGGSRGYVRSGRLAGQDELGRRARRPVRLVGQRDALGPEFQFQREAGRAHDPAPATCVRRRHPELHERRAGRCRHRVKPWQCRDAGRRQGHSHHRHGAVRRPQLERQVFDLGGLFAHRHRQRRGPGRQRVSRRANTHWAICSTAPSPAS